MTEAMSMVKLSFEVFGRVLFYFSKLKTPTKSTKMAEASSSVSSFILAGYRPVNHK